MAFKDIWRGSEGHGEDRHRDWRRYARERGGISGAFGDHERSEGRRYGSDPFGRGYGGEVDAGAFDLRRPEHGD